MAEDSTKQRITRLTPLGAILALIEARVAAVKPQQSIIAAALGYTLAEAVVASQRPPRAIALRDGFAVAAAVVADASSYAPVVLPAAARRIDVGEPLPDGADAVLPLDTVTLRGDRAEAIAAVTAGEGILPAGGDATPQMPLRRASNVLRAIDVAGIVAAGIEDVTIRMPRITIVRGGAAGSPVIDAALAALSRAATGAGASVSASAVALDAALMDEQTDAVIAVGGTGGGRRDAAVNTLARLGSVAAHGIAVSPGETAAFGFVGSRPILFIPGRLDAALAVWLLIGRQLSAKLAGGSLADAAVMLSLKRKITSTIGLTELSPVSCNGGMAEPLASGYLSFSALTRSDGWITVPAGSEGFAAGTQIAVRPWP